MIIEKIDELKQKLDLQIEQGCPYDVILKTSRDIDELLAQYYLEEIKNIT